MSKFGKLFGAKSRKEDEADKPTPKPEDITLMIQTPIPVPSEPATKEAYGLQFQLDSGEVKSFEDLPITIGRKESSQIVIEDESVSTEHARIYFDERVGSICIEDQHSLNGVFIDEMPTSKNILRDGDKIRVGNITMTFRDTGFIFEGT